MIKPLYLKNLRLKGVLNIPLKIIYHENIDRQKLTEQKN